MSFEFESFACVNSKGLRYNKVEVGENERTIILHDRYKQSFEFS